MKPDTVGVGRSIFALGGAVVVLLVAGGVAAVEVGRPDTGGPAAVRVVAGAAAAARSTTSMSFDMVFAVKANGRTVKVTMNGSADITNRRARFVGLIPNTDPIEFVTDGAVAYLAVPEDRQSFTAGKRWVRGDMTSYLARHGITSPSITDPLSTLDQLKVVSENVRRIGPARLGRVRTTKYRATILFDHLPGLSDAQRAQIQQLRTAGIRSVTTYVWIDAQGRPRKLTSALALGGARSKVTITFGHYGEPVAIAVPAAGDVFDAGDFTDASRLAAIPIA